jgi:anthranilate synthase component 1
VPKVHPPLEEVERRARGAPLVPVWCEVLCDADTPVGAYAKLRAAGRPSFLLESVVGGERWARYSFIGVGYRARVMGRWTGERLEVEVTAGPGFPAPASARGEGMAALEEVLARHRAEPVAELPRFWGGMVGVCGHDLARALESLPGRPGGEAADLPAIDLLATDTLVVFDTLSQRVELVATVCVHDEGGIAGSYARARVRLAALAAELARPGHLTALDLPEDAPAVARIAEPWRGVDYPQRVRSAQEAIGRGEVFQLVLSQRFDEPRGDLDALDVYRVLRVTNPAPYMYLLELPSAVLAGASPEVLVRVDRDDRCVTVRPIAGTRPRGRTPAEDAALEGELVADPKERAEHLMLIDLGRNDVGRVSEPGSVRLVESFAVERYSRVMHLVSEVSGRLAPGLSAVDALRATFPAGTLSGAPKVRALQLLDELEPAPRGWYGGAVGYLGYDGGADFAIGIRSVVLTPDRVRVQAGAGIVFDSVPEREDEECRRKASAVLRAIALARAARAGEARR